MICTDSGLRATDLCPANHRREELFVAGHAPQTNDNVWQTIQCGSFAEVYQVPPHDVGDLIPYDQLTARAAALGWRVPPQGGLACIAPPEAPAAGPAPAQGPPARGKHKHKP